MPELLHFFAALHAEKIEIKLYKPPSQTLYQIIAEHLRVPDPTIFGDNLAIFANGRLILGDASVIGKAYIEVFFCLSPITNPQKTVTIATVWQEDNLKVVFKPPSLSTQPSRTPFLLCLKHYVNQQAHIPSRLDYGVGGLILISENIKSHKFVHNLYATGKIAKIYIFCSFSKSNWEIKYIQTDITKSNFHPALREVSEGASTKSVFFYLDSFEEKHFYAVRIYTGKTHQIRLHAKYLGVPIIGDAFYGTPSEAPIHLLCYCLRFHYRNKLISIQVPEALLPSWLPTNILTERLNFFINIAC
jgi:23S rRNA-/tRNA-specific pseudouridylate synthase